MLTLRAVVASRGRWQRYIPTNPVFEGPSASILAEAVCCWEPDSQRSTSALGAKHSCPRDSRVGRGRSVNNACGSRDLRAGEPLREGRQL